MVAGLGEIGVGEIQIHQPEKYNQQLTITRRGVGLGEIVSRRNWMGVTTSEDVAAIVKGLTRGQRDMMKARHDESGNPWPFISITQRSGGAKGRTFAKMQDAGLYDRGNNLTPLGAAVRQHITPS